MPMFDAVCLQATLDAARICTYSCAKKVGAQNYYFEDCIQFFVVCVGLCYGSSQTKHPPSDQSN